jgi:hypothetical protein
LRARITARWIVAATAAATVLATAPALPSFAGTTLFSSGFEAGLPGWRAVVGSLDEWVTTAGEIEYATVDTRAQTSGRYITPDPELTLPETYELTARVRIDAIGDSSPVPLSVLTEWKDTSGPRLQNMAFQIPGNGGARMVRPVGGAVLCSGAAPQLFPGQWFDIVVRRAAGVIAVEIDGQRVAAVAADPAGGSVGVGVYRSKVSFDWLDVRALDAVPDDHPRQPTGCDWSAPPDPSEPQPVLVNQSGYNLDRPKRFTAPRADDGDAFTIVDESGTVRYAGTISGGVGDFTAFRPADAGDFRIVVTGAAGRGESVPFGIGASWLERVSYENAIAFMAGTRCYFGRADAAGTGWNTSQCRWSVMWRDGDTYSFEIPTLIDLFSANPAAFTGLRLPDEVYSGLRYSLPPDTPEIVRLIEWGVEMLLDNRVNHTLWKEQLAAFPRAYPDLAEWIPVELYREVRDYLFPLWGAESHDRFTSAYDYTPHTANLFQTYTQVGTGKGEFPPGHSIRANLDMYDVARREGRPDAAAYLTAAQNNAAWIVANLDWADPRTTKGQRQSEYVTVTGLVNFLDRYPELAPAGTKEKIEEWARVAVARSANMWDFRKYSADRWTIPSFAGGGAEDPNETGNVAGFAAPAMAAASVVDDPALARRLREIAVAHVDNIFGRNPVGRHASYRAPTEQWGFEGVERGWFSEYQGGAGLLQGVRGVLDGSPKNVHYPYNPAAGNVGHTEGWVSFNTAWNESLAWLAADETAVRVIDEGGATADRLVAGAPARVELAAPLNLTAGALDRATVSVRVDRDGQAPRTIEVPVTQTADTEQTFRGQIAADALDAQPGDTVTVSYGLGAFQRTAAVRVTACPKDSAATVHIGGRDTGVPNTEDAQGCTVAQRLKIGADWSSHVAFLLHVLAEAVRLLDDGLITPAQAVRLIVAAAASGGIGR